MNYASLYPQNSSFDAPTDFSKGSSKTKSHRSRNVSSPSPTIAENSVEINAKLREAPTEKPTTSQAASARPKSRPTRPRFSEPLPIITLAELNLGEDAVKPKTFNASGKARKPRRSEPMPSSSSSKEPEKEEEEIHIPKIEEYDDIVLSSERANNDLAELCQSGSHPDELPTFVKADAAQVEGFKPRIKLLDHQVRAREWMRLRENPKNNRFGGILADEMGLGKTVQMLVRILDRRREHKDGLLMPTLIICPLSILSQWKHEIERLVGLRLRVKSYYRGDRRCTIYNMIDQDIVLTTYGVVKSEHLVYKKSTDDIHASKFIKSKTIIQDKGGRSVHEKLNDMLFRMKWSCIVLDEAHEIRNATTMKAKACHELEATFRWCLTGTPFQNRASDYYSLCKFLRLRPYSNLPWFEENITQPLKTGHGAKKALNLLHIVLSRAMLRRMKDEKGPNGQALLPLPDYKLKLVKVTLQDFERKVYDAIASRFQSVLSTVLRSVTGIQLYACVWVLLLRLRQACLHPSLIAPKYDTEAKEVQNMLNPGSEEEDELEDEVEYTENRNCRLCGMRLTMDKRDAQAHLVDCGNALRMVEMFSQNPPPSAKIIAMIDILKRIRGRRGNEKTIIYSQFTSMLSKIQPFLDKDGFRYVTFDGSMNEAQRANSLKRIREDEEVTIILVSLMAGGVGLNLMDCNNVILVDLWWNPAVEEQAFARVHRMGQKRLVHIYKLVAENTVEERILALQEKKKALANATLDRNEISNVKKLTQEEILTLLRGDKR